MNFQDFYKKFLLSEDKDEIKKAYQSFLKKKKKEREEKTEDDQETNAEDTKEAEDKGKGEEETIEEPVPYIQDTPTEDTEEDLFDADETEDDISDFEDEKPEEDENQKEINFGEISDDELADKINQQFTKIFNKLIETIKEYLQEKPNIFFKKLKNSSKEETIKDFIEGYFLKRMEDADEKLFIMLNIDDFINFAVEKLNEKYLKRENPEGLVTGSTQMDQKKNNIFSSNPKDEDEDENEDEIEEPVER